jgi:hypothetical protein
MQGSFTKDFGIVMILGGDVVNGCLGVVFIAIPVLVVVFDWIARSSYLVKLWRYKKLSTTS